MDFFDVVARRYSHKGPFDSETPVPAAHLQRIVEAAMAAPSAANRQSPEFIIVNDRELLRRIGEIARHVPLATAPALIIVVCDTSEVLPGVTFYLEDYAAATENALLAATALGYACGWVDVLFHDPAVREPVSELLGVPDDRLLVVAIPIGKPAEPGERRQKKPFAQRASWNRYAIARD